jgi:hypothetical protein
LILEEQKRATIVAQDFRTSIDLKAQIDGEETSNFERN